MGGRSVTPGRALGAAVPPRDPREYSEPVADLIIEAYARGDSLLSIHTAYPDVVPPPMYVRRWVRDVPAFAMLMREAEAARAEHEAERALQDAMDDGISPARARNIMAARAALAAALHPDRFGSRRIIAGDADRPVGVANATRALSDAELHAIAAGAAGAIAPPVPPAAEGAGGGPLRNEAPRSPEGRGAPVSPALSPPDSVTVKKDES